MDPVTPQQAKKMKVAELKEALAARGASTSGLKPALQQRLLDILEGDAAQGDATAQETENEDVVPSSVAPTEASSHAEISTDTPVKHMEESAKEEEKVPSPPNIEMDTQERQEETLEEAASNSVVEEGVEALSKEKSNEPSYEPPTQQNIENVPDTTTPRATPSSLAVEDDDDEVQELRAAEERKLREEVLRSLAKKKVKTGSAPSPAVTESRPPTTHLRVDHFQRPLNPKHLREWITDIAGVTVPDNGLWLNPIKTHCYIDFSCVDDAVACRNAIIGRRWPETNPQTLVADFVTISASQAPTAPEAALLYADWITSQQSGIAPVSARKTESPRVRPAGGAADMLRNAAGAAAASVTAAAETTKARAVDKHRIEVTADGGYTTKRMKPNPDVEVETTTPRNTFLSRVPTAVPRSARDRQPQTTPLDELFRKTVATPPLYWLPLTEAEVAAKKNGRGAVNG